MCYSKRLMKIGKLIFLFVNYNLSTKESTEYLHAYVVSVFARCFLSLRLYFFLFFFFCDRRARCNGIFLNTNRTWRRSEVDTRQQDENAKYSCRREYRTDSSAVAIRRLLLTYLRRSVVVTIAPVFPSSFALRRIANQAAGRSNDIVSYGLDCHRRSVPFPSTSFSSSFSPASSSSEGGREKRSTPLCMSAASRNVADHASRPSWATDAYAVRLFVLRHCVLYHPTDSRYQDKHGM